MPPRSHSLADRSAEGSQRDHLSVLTTQESPALAQHTRLEVEQTAHVAAKLLHTETGWGSKVGRRHAQTAISGQRRPRTETGCAESAARGPPPLSASA
jgi:hypothetical protein